MTTDQKIILLSQVAPIASVNTVLLDLVKSLPVKEGRPIIDVVKKLIECQGMINQYAATIQPIDVNPILN